MSDSEQAQTANERALLEQAQARLKSLFMKMPHPVPLMLFTKPGENDQLTQSTRQVIRAIQEIAPGVDLHEYDLSHDLASRWEVQRAPTILFDPDHYRIRWTGAPAGQETQMLIEALLMMGYRKAALSADSLKMLEKIDEARSIKLFVSLTCPYCPQQGVNALMAATHKPEVVSLEIIDVQAAPALADQYAAHSVPQTFANDQLMAMGAQSQELFMLSLDKLEQQTLYIPESQATRVDTDLLIVGGGPAGLTAGIYGVRSGLRSAIVERDVLGGQVSTTPIVENYPGMNQVGGKALVDMLVSHAMEYAEIYPGEEVMEIRPGDPIVVETSRRKFTARAVLLATGASHRNLDVPGELRLSGHGVSYCSTCDGPLFKGKKAVVVGGGSGAVTEALHLHHIGVDVTLIHRKDNLRAQEHLAQNLYANDIPVLFDTAVREIRGGERVEAVELVNQKTGEASSMPVDAVFIAIGYVPATELATRIGANLTDDGFIQRDAHHRTNLPGVYCAGDVEGGYKQIVTAVGQGAEAAMAIFEDLINPYWKRDDR